MWFNILATSRFKPEWAPTCGDAHDIVIVLAHYDTMKCLHPDQISHSVISGHGANQSLPYILVMPRTNKKAATVNLWGFGLLWLWWGLILWPSTWEVNALPSWPCRPRVLSSAPTQLFSNWVKLGRCHTSLENRCTFQSLWASVIFLLLVVVYLWCT